MWPHSVPSAWERSTLVRDSHSLDVSLCMPTVRLSLWPSPRCCASPATIGSQEHLGPCLTPFRGQQAGGVCRGRAEPPIGEPGRTSAPRNGR